ncbi:MAG: HAD hydrolase family protein [Methanobacteriota archaeon]|nr:MAG: HAD hydrolase family protein [Euryarchaeota archaeon]
MRKIAFFDLEGPISTQDNAYEVLGLVPNGHKVFEVISKYDDILALERRPNYEAGDTLSLIAPFLVAHQIGENEIYEVSKKAYLVRGINRIVTQLKEQGWMVYIISTSYEQHAMNIACQLGIAEENVKCTRFPLDRYLTEFGGEDYQPILNAEREILSLHPPQNEDQIKERLDGFFFRDLPNVNVGKVLTDMSVCGGMRKVDAMKELAARDGLDISEAVAIGDSITDMRMLEFLKEQGGLSVVFNGNEYALPYGTVSLATSDMRNLSIITENWETGGKDAVLQAVRERESAGDDPYYHVLEGRDTFDDVLQVHLDMRKMVRGEAGRLG